MKTQTRSKSKRAKKYKVYWNGVPATARQTLFQVSLYESVFASFFWHAAGLLILWAIIFAFNFFGITPALFPKQQTKMQDIEFILKGSSRHSARHHRVNSVEQNNIVTTTTNDVSNAVNNSNNKSTAPKEASKHSKSSNISDFAVPMPNLKSLSSGLGGSGQARKHASGFDSSNSSINDVDSAFSSSSGSSSASGFDKNATKKMIATYDISPYVNELKRNIRWNWKAPKVNKRVELFLRIAKDGRLVILNVKRTSEIGEVDNAALNAVKKCMPLNPLPSKYNKNYLDVIFTFDGANSVGSRY